MLSFRFLELISEDEKGLRTKVGHKAKLHFLMILSYFYKFLFLFYLEFLAVVVVWEKCCVVELGEKFCGCVGRCE